MRRATHLSRHLAPALSRQLARQLSTSAASLKTAEKWIVSQKLDSRPDLARADVIVPEQHAKLAATLNADVLEPKEGGKCCTIRTRSLIQRRAEPMHAAAHWLYFLDRYRGRELAEDGYSATHSPPAPFTLRMFAGGDVTYHQRTPRIGERVRRETKLRVKPVLKQGKVWLTAGPSLCLCSCACSGSQHGPMIFVSVEHQIFAASEAKQPLMTDVQNFVYRSSEDAQDRFVAAQNDVKEEARSLLRCCLLRG